MDFSGVLVYRQNVQKFSFAKITHQKERSVVQYNVETELSWANSEHGTTDIPTDYISFEN